MPPGGHSALESRSHIHCVSMKVSPVRYCVAKIDPDAKADRSVRWQLAVEDRHLLLHPHRTPDCTIDAVEDDQQGIATRFGRFCHHAPRLPGQSGWTGGHADAGVSPHRPNRSGGYSRPCRHTSRQPASACPVACSIGVRRVASRHGPPRSRKAAADRCAKLPLESCLHDRRRSSERPSRSSPPALRETFQQMLVGAFGSVS